MRRSGASSPEFEKVVEVAVRFYPLLGAAIVLLHLGAGSLVWMLTGGGPKGVFLSVLAAAAGLRSLAQITLGRPARAVWHSDGTWTLTDRHGHSKSADLGDGLLVLPRLTVLNWHDAHGAASHAVLVTRLAGCETVRVLHRRLRASEGA